MKLDDTDLQVFDHTTQAIGRTGARTLEMGYLDDDPPHRWWAAARYAGARISCENQPTVVGALIGLYVMLAAGGGCTTCLRTVALLEPPDRIVVGARMRDGEFQTRAHRGNPRQLCVRRLEHDGWTSYVRSTA